MACHHFGTQKAYKMGNSFMSFGTKRGDLPAFPVLYNSPTLSPAGERVKKQVSSLSPSLSAQFYQLTKKPGVEEVKN